MSRKTRVGLAVVLSAVLIGIVGLLIYDRFFVPTTLVVCVNPAEKIEHVVIRSVHEGLLTRKPVNGEARFEKISKGEWKVYFAKDGYLVAKGEGMFDGVETRLYCPE